MQGVGLFTMEDQLYSKGLRILELKNDFQIDFWDRQVYDLNNPKSQ